jgi:hypothetical protein
MAPPYPRDLIGYGATSPHAQWPNAPWSGARAKAQTMLRRIH